MIRASHHFAVSVALVLEESRSVKELHQSARAKLLEFAIDTCLVAHGVRTGYLVDAVCPPNPLRTFSALLKSLREHVRQSCHVYPVSAVPDLRQSSVFKHVVLWNHSPAMQSFLVHVPLLHERLAAVVDGDGQCVFVRLDRSLSASPEPPCTLRETLCDMRSLMADSPDALSLSLSDTLAEETLVPLAAVMIDYPVAYVPAFSAQTSFLEGEALDIYDVSFKATSLSSDFTSNLQQGHTLLKFSCPRVLVSKHAELSPGTLIEKLHVKFKSPLERIGTSIRVTHRTETLGRVAL